MEPKYNHEKKSNDKYMKLFYSHSTLSYQTNVIY